MITPHPITAPVSVHHPHTPEDHREIIKIKKKKKTEKEIIIIIIITRMII